MYALSLIHISMDENSESVFEEESEFENEEDDFDFSDVSDDE